MNSIGSLLGISRIRWAYAVNRGGAGRASSWRVPAVRPGPLRVDSRTQGSVRPTVRTFGSTPGHWPSRYRGSGRKWMAISAESAARALPERRVNGTPAHRGLSTSTVMEAYVSVLRLGSTPGSST
jgi:hypothetical protein